MSDSYVLNDMKKMTPPSSHHHHKKKKKYGVYIFIMFLKQLLNIFTSHNICIGHCLHYWWVELAQICNLSNYSKYHEEKEKSFPHFPTT